MARNAVDIRCQIGVETTKGTAATVTKRLRQISLMPDTEFRTKFFRSKGYRQDTTGVLQRKMGMGEFNGQANFVEMLLIFASYFGHAAADQVEATAAYQWAINPSSVGADSFKTLTVEYGDTTNARQHLYCVPNGIKLDISKEDATISGSLISRAATDISSVTTSGVTLYEEKPISINQVDVYTADTMADLLPGGTRTKMDGVFNVSIDIGEKFAPKEVLNTTYQSFEDLAEKEYEVGVTIRCEDRSSNRTIRDAMFGSSLAGKFFRVEIIGDVIDAGEAEAVYTFFADFHLKGSTVKTDPEMDSIFGLELGLKAVVDSTSGVAHRYGFTNKLSALA